MPSPLAIPVDGRLPGRDPAEIALPAAEAERAGLARRAAAGTVGVGATVRTSGTDETARRQRGTLEALGTRT